VNVDPGVVLENVLTARITLPPARYAIESQIVDGLDRVTDAIRRTPGVITASATSSLPLAGGGLYLTRVFLRENQPEPPASADTQAGWSVVQPGYFATMGIPIVEGRDFTAQDAANSTQVIIISRAMAENMFPDGRPLGRRIRSWRDENRYREIVGVVGDLRYNGLAADIANNVYVPHTQRPWNALTVVVRTRTDPRTLLTSVRDAIWLVDRKLPLASVQTMQQVMDTEMARPRLTMFLLVLFGLAALALSAIGTYGIVAYAVTQRTREIGIRMALGAPRTRVVTAVVWKALQLAAAGLVCGFAAALALTRVLASLLFEVNATDPGVFGAAALLLLGVVVTAASIPAFRASRVDPVTALRGE
jgi:putative ABC transport system permease protein